MLPQQLLLALAQLFPKRKLDGAKCLVALLQQEPENIIQSTL